MQNVEVETRYTPFRIVAWIARICGYLGMLGAVGLALETFDVGGKSSGLMDAAALAGSALLLLLVAEAAFVLLGIEENTRKV